MRADDTAGSASGAGAVPKPRVAISACLLGERVRYDGGHRLEPILVEEFGRLLEWLPLCPEVEAGFGVPRETLRLEGEPDVPRLLTAETRREHTERMQAVSRARLEALAALGPCGFILKKNSPSCGPDCVPVWPAGPEGAPAGGPSPCARGEQEAAPRPLGVGLFARAVRERFPDLPVADEEMLRDPGRAAAFLRRVRANAAADPTRP